MQASKTKLQEIIDGEKQYVIPLFQRPYSWEKSQWELLWNDIIELYDSENSYPHFLGSIVTMQTVSGPEEVTKYLLIDGQQRLTTIFILLVVLRNKANQQDKNQISAEINERFLVNKFAQNDNYYKLQPTQIDRKAFHNIIQSESWKSKIEEGINGCYLFFDKKLRRRKNLAIQKVKNIICNSLIVVRILLEQDDNPYLVFESLNAKGKPLTQADLIRNYFFMQINPQKQDSIYENYWFPMQEILKDNLTEFIRHYVTKSGLVVKENEIYFAIKARISEGDIITHIQDVALFAEYYARFLNPELEENNQVKKYLIRINRLDINSVYPFLLNCYHDWRKQKINEAEFIDICKIIENYILRRFVCNVQTRGLNRIFALLYSQVTKKINLKQISFLDQLKLTLQTQNYPQDFEFKEKIKEVKLYGSSNRKQKAKLILESIEEHFDHKEIVSFESLTIEHIMPQKLNDWWKSHLGEDYEITYELLLHSLGNLTLTGYNPELSNDTFINKQKELDNSHLEINKYFSNIADWRREDIETRAEELADTCLQIWSYFGDLSFKSKQNKGFKGTRPKLLKFLGEEYIVKSWRDVLENTLNVIIADLELEKFDRIVEQFPRFLAKEPQNLRHTRQLKNGIFVEVNLSAKDIYSFCQKIIETCDLSSEDWRVEIID